MRVLARSANVNSGGSALDFVVSYHISQLEEHLGVALIYRSTRKSALTREGEWLLIAAQKLLEVVDAGLSDLSTSANQQTGELRLTLPFVLAQSRLSEALGIFAAVHPGIKLSLNFTDTREKLIEGGLDVAIRMGLNRKRSGHTAKAFYVERY